MAQVAPLSTAAGVPGVNNGHKGKFPAPHFATMAEFTAAITPGVTGYSADLWSVGQRITISGEPGGAYRSWNGTHARTVYVGSVQVVLAADSNVVLSSAGAPSSGTGANGDISVDQAAGNIFRKASGAWALLATINGSSGVVRASLQGGSTNNTTAIAALLASMTPGQTLQLPRGTWVADLDVPAGIKVLGEGIPTKVGSALSGGTILIGAVSSSAPGIEIGNLGIDQSTLSSSVPNGLTIAAADGTETELNAYVHDVVCLGRDFGGNSQHGFLAQNGRGFTFERVVAFNYLNNFVSRASGAKFIDSRSYDAGANAVLFKASITGGLNDSKDNEARGVIAFASGSDKHADFGVLCDDTTNARHARANSFSDCTAIASSGASARFYAVGSSSGANLTVGTRFQNCKSIGDRGSVAFLADANTDATVFLACQEIDTNGFSFRSNASASNTTIAVACTGTAGTNGTWSFLQYNGSIANLKGVNASVTGELTVGNMFTNVTGGGKITNFATYGGGLRSYKSGGVANNVFSAFYGCSDNSSFTIAMTSGASAVGDETYDVTGLFGTADATRGARINVNRATAPTARLHLPPGLAAAGFAPLKIDAGVLLTTAESGAIESDGTSLYWTTSAGVRKTITVT